MKNDDAETLVNEIHRNKSYRPTEWERKFLEDLSFHLTIGNIRVSDKQGKALENIYRKSTGG